MLSIWLIGVVVIIVTYILYWITFSGKSALKNEKKYNPKYAEKMNRFDGITPFKGSIGVVVNPQKWVMVNWDKSKNFLQIVTTPQGRLEQENRVQMRIINWKIINEYQPKKVTVDEYFGNRRIM